MTVWSSGLIIASLEIQTKQPVNRNNGRLPQWAAPRRSAAGPHPTDSHLPPSYFVAGMAAKRPWGRSLTNGEADCYNAP